MRRATSAETLAADESVVANPGAPTRRRPSPVRRGAASDRWRWIALIGWLGLPAIVVLVGPWLWPVDPIRQQPTARLSPPTLERPLGTDQFGRDLLARLLHGGRLSLGVSLVVTAITATVGVALGSVAASRGGVADTLLSRVTDLLLALPLLLVALTVAGLAGGGIGGIVLALSLIAWATYARIARAETLRVQTLPFVEAARASGATGWQTFWWRLAPTMAPTLIVLIVVRFAQTLLTIAGLSFLGVGVNPPTPEWGAMLNEGLPFLERAPHLALLPGAAVTLACFTISLAADRLRRHLDPTSRHSIN